MRVLLVDVYNIYARAKFSTGMRIDNGGLFGYIRMVRAQERTHDKVVHCLEGGGSAARKEVDAGYKGDRVDAEPMFPEGHYDALLEWAGHAGHLTAYAPGCEADDVIAYLANGGWQEHTTIFSSDHDFKQCLRQDRVVQMLSTDKPLRTEKDVVEEIGRPPSDYWKLLAIAGDSTDSVRNVPRVGTATALKILVECDWDMERVFAHPKVEAHADLVRSNQDLVRFIDPGDSLQLVGSPELRNDEALDSFYEHWNFSSLRGKQAWNS